jgi:hypothetical protein
MKTKIMVGMVGVALLGVTQQVSAATLSGSLTADNAFYAFISTNNAVLGTEVASGNSWPTVFDFGPSALTPGVTNYLQIEAINYGGPGMFVGSFSLSGSGYQFANGQQTISTDTTNWNGIFNNTNSDPFVIQPWVQPTGAVENEIGYYNWGLSLVPPAEYIWSADVPNGCAFDGGSCTVDLSTPIFATATPLPAAFPLFAGGLGVMGMFARRRKQKASNALAAA